MKTTIKFQLVYFVQDMVIKFLILRAKVKRWMNPNPRSFWDL